MSFNKLPPEILLEISQYIKQEYLRKLSSACRQFMAVLQCKAYSTLHFDETSKSAYPVFAIALGPRKQLVRTIRFVPHDPRPDQNESADQGIKLSDKSRQVLGSLHKFPMLYKFQFDLSTWRIDQWSDMPFHERYDLRTRRPETDSVPWRHIILQSLKALIPHGSTQNRGAFSCLEMKALPPTQDFRQILLKPAWLDLVKDLKTFEVSLAVIESE
ncbi:hypothetical protein NW768_002065 [Fusarium equiseti]|uniref:F-box domain-containing protein n=1 Tax=Fusarium equiseti TaxID=61235 RepID=A0ABQ8RMT0_FUSEQ|nr:hypothetical protein NW768_002065 [Fusarium equiseti]